MHDPRKLIPIILISCALCGCGQDAEYPDTSQETDSTRLSQTEIDDKDAEIKESESVGNEASEESAVSTNPVIEAFDPFFIDGYEIVFPDPDKKYKQVYDIKEIRKDGVTIMTASYWDVSYPLGYRDLRTVKDGFSHCEYEYQVTTNTFDQRPYISREVRDGVEILYEIEYSPDEKCNVYKGFQIGEKEYKYIWSKMENGGIDRIVGIADENGQEIARYTYGDEEGFENLFLLVTSVWELSDGEWGKNEDTDFIGNYNKIRYTSYYYDDETGWYYSPYAGYMTADGKIFLQILPD